MIEILSAHILRLVASNYHRLRLMTLNMRIIMAKKSKKRDLELSSGPPKSFISFFFGITILVWTFSSFRLSSAAYNGLSNYTLFFFFFICLI